MMTLDEFERLLDVLGSDSTRWPDDMRTEADRLVARSPEAARALYEARRLDAALEVARPQIADATVARVLQAALASLSRPRVQFQVVLRSWGLAPLWPRLGFLAAALALGIIIGGHVGESHSRLGERVTQLVWPTYAAEFLVGQ
jgi:hypothetical protein